MLIEEWAFLPQEMLQQLVLSMRRRCEATIASLEEGEDRWENPDNLQGDGFSKLKCKRATSSNLPCMGLKATVNNWRTSSRGGLFGIRSARIKRMVTIVI
ncbi:hypothetical protein TNCV_309051 [Trichonephila clavipes]|nr:hypothetical protein TNCV_309051 [Trichonephila clavipes]